MLTPLDRLRAARDLLTDPAKWTKGAFARDVNGYGVPPESDQAVAWCAEGALLIRPPWNFDAHRFLEKVGPVAFGVPDYNDDLATHAELLAWFDRAIALAEAP